MQPLLMIVDGILMQELVSTTALSFTAGDNTLPTLSSSSPADNATSVCRECKYSFKL